MPSNRTLVMIGAVVGVAAVGFAVAATAAQRDPVTPIGSVAVGPVAPGALATTAPGAPEQVPGLDELRGTFARQGDDRDEFRLDGVELELGPEEWLRVADPIADYDGDGRLEPVLAELDGLVGKRVTALVRLDGDGDDGAIYVLAGKPFRDVTGGPAPWQDRATSPGAPPPASGAAASAEDVQRAAEAAVGPGARAVEIDREDDPGEEAWEVEVIGADNREYQVELDTTAGVRRVRED